MGLLAIIEMCNRVPQERWCNDISSFILGSNFDTDPLFRIPFNLTLGQQVLRDTTLWNVIQWLYIHRVAYILSIGTRDNFRLQMGHNSVQFTAILRWFADNISGHVSDVLTMRLRGLL